ncbi:protein kinase domain-containing protein [Pendulispora albinea]|uniref:Protein kinase n=1 Tax=Pendulispora albinea TaxID=2741071 RepID=A0ABZ2LV88_9BACT
MLKPGDTFERYTIEAPLGQGGMGCVYRAHDTRLGRRVALKVISDGQRDERADAEANARLLREARAAAAFDHPNAVSIFDVGEYEGTPFIVMELVLGRTLREAVGDASVPAATRVAELADVARALAVAHKRGLVHRDIKPENVMVREDGVVKVLDFGIARRQGGSLGPHGTAAAPALPTLTIEGVKLGTPSYMAPEQILGEALDGRTDQFAWGVVAYELLAGRLPWRESGDAMAVMASVLIDRVDRAPLDQAAVPRAIQDVVLRALEKRPENRFPSMDDVAHALDAAVRAGDEPESAKPRRAPEQLARGATDAQRFSTGEVRDVLAKAIDQQGEREGSTKLSFEDLLAVAAEVGIDPDSLREASRALRASKQQPSAADGDFVKKRDAWFRQQRLNLYRHAGVYGIVNAGILVLGLVLLSFTPWWIWFLPLVGWGIGLAIHALVALTASEQDFREHDAGEKWWYENQQRQHDERMARRVPREARQMAAPAERRARFEPSPGRVRVAPSDTGGEWEAEEEAAATWEGRKEKQRQRPR